MKQPILFFLFLALIISLAVVVLKPGLVLRPVLGGGARSLSEFADDQDARSFDAWLSERQWKQIEEEEHPALRPGCRITVWGQIGRGGERLRAVTRDGKSRVLDEPEQLEGFLKPVNSAQAARAVSDLVRRVVPGLCTPMNPKVGTPLEPSADPSAEILRSGRYRPEDAKRWGVKFGVRKRSTGDGFSIEHIALVPKGEGETGWNIALIEERIGPDGSFSMKVLRILPGDPTPFVVKEW